MQEAINTVGHTMSIASLPLAKHQEAGRALNYIISALLPREKPAVAAADGVKG